MKYVSSFEPTLIYVMRINDPAHEGCLKIGKASVNYEEASSLQPAPNSNILNQAAKKRINEYTQTAGIAYDLLYTESTLYFSEKRIKAFLDHDVHEVLERSGIKKKVFNTEAKADEWYITDLETVKKAITAVKQGRRSLNVSEITQGQSPIVFRPEQKEAIAKTEKQFKKSNRMLWNAKMRFGKTLSALQVVKDMNFVRTLILTHRPVVNDGWFDDFKKIFYDRDDFFYGSKNKGNTFDYVERLVQQRIGHYVYFASLQDLRGSELVGGKFDKNDEIFGVNWDLVIIDEAHEGTQTELGKSVLKELEKDNTKILQLSGTPFNLLDEHTGDAIYTWDYVMEQKAKRDWDILHKGDPNPYASLPHLNIFTFDLGKMLGKYQDEELAFNFHEFFRVDENGVFIHQQDVRSFLDLICKTDESSNYPYSTEEYRRNFRHSLWMIPGVKSARALSTMLQQHPVFSQFEIVNVAGDGDEDVKSEDALQMVHKAIGEDPDETYTITLSCGRLTTGVSVPAWTAVFMLAGSFNTSAANYMQTIFRVQTPATINGRMKTECFVFDFAPDRTLKVIAETAKVSAKAGKTGEDGHRIMGDFLNFCPVISVDGTQMRPYNANQMLEQLKRVYVERVVRNGFEDGYLYNNDLLMKLDGGDLTEFNNLKKIIGSTKAMQKSGDIDLNKQGFTNEEYEELDGIEQKKRKKEELTPEELKLLEEKKEKKKNRDSAVSILRGISIRMPLMIYGAELTDESEITLDNFTSLIDAKSWEEFMPRGVTKQLFNSFKKYYDPDIFRAAGKRIRAMAKAADDEDIEERIALIASIFKSFRNPDKETVLTPWCVVNMHLSESLGGYTFWNEDFSEIISEPRWVDHGEVTAEVFTPDSQILEINSKSGLYPLCMAYSIYRVRRNAVNESDSDQKFSHDEQYSLWEKVLAENIFVICKTPMAKSITKRTLLGFRDAKINAHCFEDLINTLKDRPRQFIERITRRSFWKKGDGPMKFDAVVGNPPYQVTANGEANGSDPIYHLFIDAGRAAGARGTFIHPGRFLFKAGKTPKEWNEKILNDEHFKVVRYWSNSNEIFPSVDIMGGIAITYWDKRNSFNKIGLFTAYPELQTIVQKIITESFQTFSNLVFAAESYNFTQVLHDENPSVKSRLSVGHMFDLKSNVFDKLPDIFLDSPQGEDIFVQVYGLLKKKRTLKWIKEKYLKTAENFTTYKIFVPKANGSGAIGEGASTIVIGQPALGQPYTGHTQSFISIGNFSSQREAENCQKYVKTKFARTLLGVLKVTQDNPKKTWANVPLQDFTVSSDIDWSRSIAEIDQQLYAKYGLSAAEINFIETTIKPME